MRKFLHTGLVLTVLVAGAWYYLHGVLPRPLPEFEISGQTMGTSYRVIVVNPEEKELDTLGQQVQERLAGIEARYTTWKADSELSRLNTARPDAWHPVSGEFCNTLSGALAVSRQTDGAYDPTVGYLVALWGFASYEEPKSVPDQSAIDAAMANTGYRRVQLDCENQQILKHGNVSIDLSGYVKGFAADEILMLLNQAGIYAALVEVGGEIATLRSNRSPGWRIAIETPGMPETRPPDVIHLYSQGIATSGDYRNYFEVDGVRYSHVIDPASGRPVSHDTVSVSVVADSTMEADAWATALLVMGTERGLEAAEKNSIAAFFVDRVGDTLTTASSSGFDRFSDSR